MANEQRYGTGLDDLILPQSIDDDLGVVDFAQAPSSDIVTWSAVDCQTKECEAIVEVEIQDPRIFTGGEGYRFESLSTPFTWRGVEWTVLIRKQAPYEIYYYLGIDDPSKLPIDFSLAPQFTISFVDSDNNVVAESVKTNSDTRKLKYYQYALNPSRDDLGQSDLFTGVTKDALREDVYAFYNRQTHGQAVPMEAMAAEHSYSAYGVSTYQDQKPGNVWAHLRPYKMKLQVRMRVNFAKAATPYSDPKAQCGVVGILNLGATCYLNALLQMLFHIDGFRRLVFAMPHQTEVYGSSTTLGIQEVFKNLQYSRNTVDTRDLLRAFGWGNAEAFMQQDVQEMMRVLLDKIEEKAKETICDGRIKDLFGGTVRSFISCTNVEYESKREEDFYDIQLDVKGCTNMYESFKRYTESEMLEGDNQYDAGPQFGKQDAKKGVIFTRLPPVLTIHLKRFDFDLKHMGYRKIHDHFAFPTWTNLDAFIAPDAPHECLTGNDYILHSVLVHSGDFGGGHYYAYIRPMCDSQTEFDYRQHAASIKPDADKAMKTYLEECASTEQNATPNRDPMRNLAESMNTLGRGGKWYKFDDEHVYAVEDEEAIDYCFGRKDQGINSSLASAYMLLYIRASAVSDVMRKFDQSLDEDIPKSLVARLGAEAQAKKLQLRLKQQSKEGWMTFNGFTEESLRCFTILTNKAYLRDGGIHNILSQNVATFKIEQEVLHDSLFLRVHIKVAEQLKVSPFRLCVYKTDYARTECIRKIGTRLTPEMLGHSSTWNNKGLFVYAEVASDADVLHVGMVAEDAEFQAVWEQCKDDEREWMVRLRRFLYFDHATESNVFGAHVEGSAAAQAATAENRRLIDSLTLGYGMGGPDTWKDLVKETNNLTPIHEVEDMIARFETEIRRIEATLLERLQMPGPFISGPLLLLKVFDPSSAFDNSIKANTKPLTSLNDCTHAQKDVESGNEENKVDVFSEADYERRTKYFKFLAAIRISVDLGDDSNPHGEKKESDDRDDSSDDEASKNGIERSGGRLVSAVNDALLRLPGLSPELTQSIQQWKLYLGKSLQLDSQNLLSEYIGNNGPFGDCAVIVIDPGYAQIKELTDPAAIMNPGIDKSYEKWSTYVVERIPLKCAMLNDAMECNMTALRALSASKSLTSNVGMKRTLHTEHAGEACEILPQFSRFFVETTNESTFRDVSRFIGLQLDVEPNNILLWVETSKMEIAYSSERDSNNFFSFSAREDCYVKGGDSTLVPAVAHIFIYYSIAPFPVVHLVGEDYEEITEKKKFCVTVTDARLRMWRGLKRECVHKALREGSLKPRKCKAGDDSEKHETVMPGADLIAFPVDSEMLSRISADCAMLSTGADLNLLYSRTDIEALCDMPPEQRELHLMDSSVFFRLENESWTVGDMMEMLRSVIGLPTNARELFGSIVSALEYACAQSEAVGNAEMPPGCCGNPIELSNPSMESLRFATERANMLSSVLNFFSETPPTAGRANNDSNIVASMQGAIHDMVEANLRGDEENENDLVLALLDVRDKNNTIFGVYFHTFQAVSTHQCWPGALEMPTWPNTWHLAVQSISVGDLPYMRNIAPCVRSMPVQVLSFRSSEPNADFVSENLGFNSGHVLTYVREDDTYARLAARVATLIGDSNELDMYVVQPPAGRRHSSKSRVHKLPRIYKRTESPLSELGLPIESTVSMHMQAIDELQDDGSMHLSTAETEASSLPDDESQPDETVWAAFKQFYPYYATQAHDNAKLREISEYPYRAGRESDLVAIHYPILALRMLEEEDEGEEDGELKEEQDSLRRRPRSNSASSAASEGLKRRKSSQIMIN